MNVSQGCNEVKRTENKSKTFILKITQPLWHLRSVILHFTNNFRLYKVSIHWNFWPKQLINECATKNYLKPRCHIVLNEMQKNLHSLKKVQFLLLIKIVGKWLQLSNIILLYTFQKINIYIIKLSNVGKLNLMTFQFPTRKE